MDIADADYLLLRGWFHEPADVYIIFRELSDSDFWSLYHQRAKYNRLVTLSFATCAVFPPPQFKIKLNVIEDVEEKVYKKADIRKEWDEYFKTIEVEIPEFEKEETIAEIEREIDSVQNILDNYRSNKNRHDKQIVNDYISSLKDLKIQRSKLETEKKELYDNWVRLKFEKFQRKTNLS